MKQYILEERPPRWDELPDFFYGCRTEYIYKTDSPIVFAQAIFNGEYVNLICKCEDQYCVYSKHSIDDKWFAMCNSLAGAYYWIYGDGAYSYELTQLPEESADIYAVCKECLNVYIREDGCECKEEDNV